MAPQKMTARRTGAGSHDHKSKIVREPDYESQKPLERLSGNALPGTPRGRRSERLLSVGE